MPDTLLFRLQAPMQAWGSQSLFSVRDTAREPTRSGVVGLLCAALGRSRDDPLDDLASLRMGVRVDQEGTVMKDFQTARNILNSVGKSGANVISDRYYLADAAFLVGLESNDSELLLRLQLALQKPRWLLFLGRRAFPPTGPVWLPDGLRHDETLEEALRNYPYLLDKQRLERTGRLRMLVEDRSGSIIQRDMPHSFEKREFVQRIQRAGFVDKPYQCLQEVLDVS